ncbi:MULTISPECIES: glycohydrolase toxin TNT-related protein [Listeria]|uniref:TNT domain-containing protein n=1 Tax=Listeria TaxID=1637 RepID=UPI001FC98227|nr:MULTISPECIES: glycohydrolase toxin TNT-related protein [Listeria]
MKDVHYQEDDFEKAEKSIGNLIGKGAWGKGAIDSLKGVSKNLEEVEIDIARLDADGAIPFSHTDNKHKLQELYEDFEVLHDFAGEVGGIVNDKIDQPFYEVLDEFVEGMRDLDASKVTTKNRIGSTKTVTTYANSYTQEQMEVPKKEVSLDDLFSGDNDYANQMKLQYEEWKRQNKDQDVSQKEFRSAMLNSRAFEYTSIKDEQQKKEFWVNVIATVVIVGVAVLCPYTLVIAGIGLAYGGLEASAAIRGKDWLTGRELDTSERVIRGAFSILDIVPGVKAFSGGTQVIRSGTKLADLSDNLLQGVKSVPSKVDDLINLGQKSALTRINSLKVTVKEGIHTRVEKATRVLDEVGKVADNLKNNLNLNPRRQLAADGLGAAPLGGSSRVSNATEKMKEVLQKYDLNLNSGGRQVDDIIKGTNKVFEPKKVVLKNGETAYKSTHGELVRSPDCLNKEGEIKWPDADGFVCDSAGKPSTIDANLKKGQVIDRYGDPFGKFTSPVEDGRILEYDTRGLPYPESVKPYHQYEVIKDINLENVKEAFNGLNMGEQRNLLDSMKDYKFTFKDIANPQQGTIAEVFGAGGGTQIQLGTVVDWYEKLGLLKEVK